MANITLPPLPPRTDRWMDRPTKADRDFQTMLKHAKMLPESIPNLYFPRHFKQNALTFTLVQKINIGNFKTWS